MYVKDYMTRNPYTITPNKTVSDAINVMSVSDVHRLPVVDQKGKLIGLLTQGRIQKNTPNNTSTLSVFELNYLLNKLSVNDIMKNVEDVVTIGPDALLEEAATVMRKDDIGSLPVVDKDNNLIGIITHNDIFDAFVELLGYNKQATRYVVTVNDDTPGIMEGIAKICSENNISISNLAVYHNERGIEVCVITYGDNDIVDKFKAAGYNVTGYLKLTGQN